MNNNKKENPLFNPFYEDNWKKIHNKNKQKYNSLTKKMKVVPVNFLLKDNPFHLKNELLNFYNNKDYIKTQQNEFPLIYNGYTYKNSRPKFNTVNNLYIDNNLYEPHKPAAFVILDQFDEIDKQFHQNTKYYEALVKSGDKSNRFHNKYSKNLNSTFLTTKKNYGKQCSTIYNRIKSMKDDY